MVSGKYRGGRHLHRSDTRNISPSLGCDRKDDKHGERREDKWHIQKGIDAGHFLTTIGLIIVVATNWVTMSERIASLEVQTNSTSASLSEQMIRQRGRDERQDQEILELRRQIVAELNQIQVMMTGLNQRIDRVLDRQEAND